MARKLGEILVDAGVVDEQQLSIALAEQRKVGGRLGEILAELGFTTEEEISRSLASQSGVDHTDLDREEMDSRALELVEERMARRLHVLPLRVEGDNLVIAMSNPTDIVAIDEVQNQTHLFVRVISASHRQLLTAIDTAYGDPARRESAFDEVIQRALAEVEQHENPENRGGVIALVEALIAAAVRRDATDLHLEPDRRVVRVRFRIDGELTQGASLRKSLHGSVVARAKVIAGLDISETRVPQDGKIRFEIDQRVVDLRVSTFPSVDGESVVIRILDKNRQVFSLEAIGLAEREREILRRAAGRPNGLVLAAGPTGSGKTTTLFATIREVDATRRKIITLEDPAEYDLPMVTQCQINTKAGLTFASGLRSILRHDPDVVLVGEMRDTETATMAVRAALTGHLVFSSIHTNDAIRTISRLLDMGIDPFLVASCLSVVAAQRLVRKNCSHCRDTYEPTPEEIASVGLRPGTAGPFSRGKGCDRCHGTGMRGREALFEVLEVTPAVSSMIGRRAPVDEIEELAREEGMTSFREAAIERARSGEISLAEVARVTAEF